MYEKSVVPGLFKMRNIFELDHYLLRQIISVPRKLFERLKVMLRMSGFISETYPVLETYFKISLPGGRSLF